MDRYIILRDGNAGVRGGQSFGFSATASAGAAAAIPPEPQVDAVELNDAEAKDLTRSSEVLGIARVMPTSLITPMAEPAEAQAAGNSTWGVTEVGAMATTADGTGVAVSILDTGIHKEHVAFAGMEIVEKDFSGDGNGDVNGHGTHCAGTAFGRDVNGMRIGVAPGVPKAIIGKVLGDNGSGSSEMMFKGMQWAFDEGARVISMSLGFDFPGFAVRLQQSGVQENLAVSIALEGYRQNLRVFDRIMDMFRARAGLGLGAVIVGAAGNESMRQVNPDHEVSVAVPAAAEGIISVGAAGQAGGGMLNIADFSNTGPILSGPGVGVVSARTQTTDGLVSLNGTSMATPHVAGLAALWWQFLATSPVPLSDKLVSAQLMATARADRFTAATDISDRGLGMAQAPGQVMN